MPSTVAYSLLFARLATAIYYNGGKSGSGYYAEGAYGQDRPGDFDISAFQIGAANPNASNSVNVSGFVWRTNVSEVVPNDATDINGTAIVNARVISTVFDLRWQVNGTIGTALQNQGVVAPFGCFMMMDGLDLPQNVTSKYTAADNGTCTNLLGDDCVKDFLASLKTPDGSSCPAYPAAADLPASCAGTLGVAQSGFNGVNGDLESLHGVPDPGPLQSGQGFAHITSSAFNGSDATIALQQAESRLQILVIKGLNLMACQKVNSTVTVASAPTPAGTTPSSTTSAADAPPSSSTKTNSASVMRQDSHAVLGLTMLGAVFLGL